MTESLKLAKKLQPHNYGSRPNQRGRLQTIRLKQNENEMYMSNTANKKNHLYFRQDYCNTIFKSDKDIDSKTIKIQISGLKTYANIAEK